MLDQHTEEAFDGSVQRPMHHDRLLACSVVCDIFKTEASRKIEIELHGGKLPQSSDGIHQLNINFRAVERGFAGDRLIFNPQPLQNFF